MIELGPLERYARRATERRMHDHAACELCGLTIDGAEHRHVVDVIERALKCACRPCALVFEHDEGRLRAVPTEVHAAEPFDRAQRDTLRVPVGLAFFTKSSAVKRWVAIFPSPAGATEAEVEEDAARVLDESFARHARSDVEAVLVRTKRDGRCDCFITPIDVCYECVAALRIHWKGISGGDEAHQAIDEIIERLRVKHTTRRP